MSSATRAKKKDGRLDEELENSILARLTKEHQQLSTGDAAADVTILFCGAKRAGKTSLIDRWIKPDKDEKDVPKPTVALDYKFARYASDSASSKTLAHIYELGGEENQDELAAIPVSVNTAGNLVLAIVLDLSEPHAVLPTLERWLKLLHSQAVAALERLAAGSAAGAQRAQAIQAARTQPYAEHPDGQAVRSFPVQLVIFGSKWDLLAAEHDPEKRKALCRAMRYFAHTNGATLVFCSLKDKVSMNNARGVIRQVLFGAPMKGGIPEQTDPSKPLCVPAGRDFLPSIGAPQGGSASDRGWRDLIDDIFPDPSRLSKEPKKSEVAAVAEDLHKFPESSIDGMVEQRLEELQQYRRQAERNQRLASEGIGGRKDLAVGAG